MNNLEITWKGPQISKVKKTKSTISFDATHITGDTAQIKITRVKKGWVYEDLGMLVRLFNNAEYLRWEYEYPSWLVAELKKLKATKYNYTEGFSQDAYDRMVKDIAPLVSQINSL